MKQPVAQLQMLLVLFAVTFLPHFASAGTTFTQTVTPAAGSAIPGTATVNSYPTGIKATASGSYTGGAITLSSSVAYANGATSTPGITVAFTTPTYGGNSTPLNATNGFTVTTTSGTVAGIYTVTMIGTNTSAKAQTNTYVLTVAVPSPVVVWAPAGADTNWSTANNWAPNGAPGSSSDVKFFDAGAVASLGTVDNVADNNFTVSSLVYGQTNNTHTTLVASGKTLNVTGANGLSAGTGNDNGDFVTTANAVTGAGGALVVNNSSALINIGQAHATANNALSSSKAVLDMSGLGSFSATASRLLVGMDLTIRGSAGVLYLARTNQITLSGTAPQLDVGDNSQNQGTPTVPSLLLLGQTNSIFADSIVVGRGKTDLNGASMLFNSAFASPSAYFRGTNGGASRVSSWTIGDGAGSRTYLAIGTNDFSLGTVDARVDTMFVGKGASVALGGGANDPGTGFLTFSAGTIDVNTLEVGYCINAPGTGTVNVNGGSLVVNTTFELGHSTTNIGAGTLNISSATVTANNGIINGGYAAGSTATITMNNGTLNVTNTTATIGTTDSPINNFSIANSALKVAVQSFVPSVAVANLTVGGVGNTINVSAVPLLTGFPTQFPVIQYGIDGGSTSGDLTAFTVGTLPSGSPPYGAYMSNNVANNSIDIVFTNGPSIPSLTWDGTPNGDWNTTTTNWRPKTGPDVAYGQGNFTTFNDSLTGTAHVNLTTALTPALVTVSNNSTNYVFTGTGSLGGGMVLIKSGSASLTLAETGGDNFSGGIIVNGGKLILDNANNNSSGGTTINGGMVQLGNNDSTGSLPAGGVDNSGTILFNRTDNFSVGNIVGGSGTLIQSNLNVTTLSGNNTFSGEVLVKQGTLNVGSPNGLGQASGVTITSGATLDVGGQSLFASNADLTITVSGPGVGGNGAIVNSSTNDQTKVLHAVTMTGDTTFGGDSNWDIRNSSGSTATADASLIGAYNLTKVGTNTVSLRGVAIDGGLGNINIQAGGLTFSSTATAPISTLGSPSATITVLTNGTLTLDIDGNVPAKLIVLTNGGTLRSTATNTVSSAVTLLGDANNTITANTGSQLTISSAIGGPGGFSKNGSSSLILNAANTYGGNTVVSGGTLVLYGGGFDGSINSSTNINVNSGSTLDVSGRTDGTLTLVSGQTLVGGADTNQPGTINGVLIANVGATVSPGTSTTNIGALLVTGNATLHGATVMKIDAGVGTNDQFSAYGITYGGTLTVANLSGSPTNGQSFKLFATSTGYTNSFSSVILPTGTGLTWTDTLATDGKITAVVAGTFPPSITGISPNTGRTNGGTVVAINGSNFVNNATVQFGASTPITATFIDSAHLTVPTPALPAGAVVVTVKNPDAQTATTSYTYVLPPPPATIVPGSVKLGLTSLSMTWLGGTNSSCVLFTTTNIVTPNWTPMATNSVGANGLSTNVVPVNAGESRRFYRLMIPYN